MLKLIQKDNSIWIECHVPTSLPKIYIYLDYLQHFIMARDMSINPLRRTWAKYGQSHLFDLAHFAIKKSAYYFDQVII